MHITRASRCASMALSSCSRAALGSTVPANAQSRSALYGIAQRRYAGLPNRIFAGSKKLALRVGGIRQSRRPSLVFSYAHTSQPRPAFHDDIVQLFAQKIVHHAFVSPLTSRSPQRCHRTTDGPALPAQQPAHRVSGVAVIRITPVEVVPAQHGRLFAAQLLACRGACSLRCAGLQSLTKCRNLLPSRFTRRICEQNAPRLARLPPRFPAQCAPWPISASSRPLQVPARPDSFACAM